LPGPASEHFPYMPDDTDDDVASIAGRGQSDLGSGNLGSWPHDSDDAADRRADAERVAAASSGPEDPADASAGDAADVPANSDAAAPGSSEAFPPIGQ
jgi:hypothetical protein